MLPPPSSLLPPADPSFVGRVHDLGDICAALAPGSRSHNSSGSGSGSNEEPVTALLCVGPGGAGKSALLLEYLHLYEEEAAYTFVWWCDAHSEATLAASLRAIAGAAGLRDATGDPAAGAGYDYDRLCAAFVRAALARRGGWCFVLDGLSDGAAALLTDAGRGGVLAPGGPSLAGGGHVLVTARETDGGVAVSVGRWQRWLTRCCDRGAGEVGDAGAGAGGSIPSVRRLEVGPMSTEDAVELLQQHSADGDATAAAAVATLLDRHAAALVEAAALVRARALFDSLAAYRRTVTAELQQQEEKEEE